MRPFAVGATLLSAVSIALLSLYVLRQRRAPARLALAVVLAAGAAGYAAYAMELLTTGAARQVWGDLKYVGVLVLPPAFLVFNLQYTGRLRRSSARLLLAIGVVPAEVGVLLAIPATHDLVRVYRPGALEAPVAAAHLGPIGAVLVAYSAVLVGTGTLITIATLVRISDAYRRTTALLAVALALPWLVNLLYDFNVPPFATFDPTAEILAVSGAVLVWGVFRFRLVDLVPLARAAVVERMQEAVVVLDPGGRVLDLNPAAAELAAIRRTAAIGRRFADLVPVPHDLLATRTTQTGEMALGPSPITRHYEVKVSALPAPAGEEGGRLVVIGDITDRKAAEARLLRLAHVDPLTGLANRRVLDERLAQAISAATRHGTALALLYLDLDGFKAVNDRCGHETGDEVLRQAAARLTACLRAEDTIARIGGDEFAVLLIGVTGRSAVAAAAAKLLDAFDRPIGAGGERHAVTLSIGAAVWPDDASEGNELLARADAAMYRAKRTGGGRVALSGGEVAPAPAAPAHPPTPAVTARRDLAGTLVGLETTLLTASAPPGGRAEHIRRVCTALAGPADGTTTLGVTLVVGAADLCDPVLVAELIDALPRAGLGAGRITVAFADRASAGEHDRMAAGLGAMRAHGIRLALDDYGAGATSPQRLAALAPDEVRLPPGLVAGARHDPRLRLATEGAVHLARLLSCTVVVCGVDQRADLDLARAVGADVVVGRMSAGLCAAAAPR